MSEAFVNAWRPNPVEADAPIREIEGEIPRELCGTLYRNGPNQKILPEGGHRALHLFDGPAGGLAHLVIGFNPLLVPFRGGVLVPNPDEIG